MLISSIRELRYTKTNKKTEVILIRVTPCRFASGIKKYTPTANTHSVRYECIAARQKADANAISRNAEVTRSKRALASN